MTSPGHLALRDYYMPMTTALMEGMFAKDKLDAIVYPTNMTRPELVASPPGIAIPTATSPRGIANLTGSPI